MQWPNGKKFAFTIFDDTDESFLPGVRQVYQLLERLNLRITKSVWTLDGAGDARRFGTTCADQEYRKWALELQRAGFEIALHNVSYDTSTREKTVAGFEAFKEIFGSYPRSLANHYGCGEGIYWGKDRLSGLNRSLYDLLTRGRNRDIGVGHREESPLFWGDLCRDKVTYVRNFAFQGINTLRSCPQMPYYDPDRPYVSRWFAGTNGRDCSTYVKALSRQNQDQLERDGGACILYTHFGYGFAKNGELNPDFVRVTEELAARNGWFVPVSQLLDYLAEVNGVTTLGRSARQAMERRWLIEKIFVGTT